jgi:hypothetical protein
MTDPTSRQRGRPKWTGQQLSQGRKHLVMSPSWGSTPRQIDRLTVSCNMTLTCLHEEPELTDLFPSAVQWPAQSASLLWVEPPERGLSEDVVTAALRCL